MVTGIFDSHAHYDDDRFNEDVDEVLGGLFNESVSYILNCACNYNSCLTTLKLADKYPNFYAALGVHPHDAETTTDNDLENIKQLLKHEKALAVGEIGLDYYYDFADREVQKELFRKQIILANELNLPVIIHDREAHKDTLDILHELKPKGVVHCFSGSAEMAKEIIKLGLYIGIGGAVTFKNAKHPIDVVATVPIERILLETDAPYMTPVPFRGKRCDSAHIEYTAQKIAEIKNLPVQTVIDICRDNAKNLFAIQ